MGDLTAINSRALRNVATGVRALSLLHYTDMMSGDYQWRTLANSGFNGTAIRPRCAFSIACGRLA
jgi:hypothetical protein